MTLIRTFSGMDVPLHDPQPEHIAPRDIAHHLSLINRFTGASMLPVSVAQHSVAVAKLLAHARQPVEVQLLGLLHDAHEAYLGDVSRPLKTLLGLYPWPQPAIDVLDRLATAFDHAIWRRFGIRRAATQEALAHVRDADDRVLAAEWRDLMPGPCPLAVEAAPFPVKPLVWDRAQDEFAGLLERLCLQSGTAFHASPGLTSNQG